MHRFLKKPLLIFLPLLLLMTQLLSIRVPAASAAAPDWAITGGHYFTQAAGGQGGFSVVDDTEARFWREFQRLGGLDTVGYPISRRFIYDGFVTQAFQKLVLQWRPEVNQAWPVNVFDELSKKGFNDALLGRRQTPRPFPDGSFDTPGASWVEVVAKRQALLDVNGAIRARYFSVADPLNVFGLPTSRVEDMGNHYAIRTQRAVFQQWKENVPWAVKGQVTIANGGDIAKELGWLTGLSLQPEQGPVSPTPVPATPVPGNNGLIGGRVWHDLCAVSGGEGGAPLNLSENCVLFGDGSYTADGTLQDNEPGIGGVRVNLGAGACPANALPTTGLATATTAADGSYQFTRLAAGTYCVSVDALQSSNSSILLPGRWTAPEPDKARITVQLAANQQEPHIGFGWDYQFLPDPKAARCTNQAAFVADITIPDGTPLQAGETFVKTWRVRNTGTCTWDSSYSLTYNGGSEMGAPTKRALGQVVSPGSTVDLSLTLTAPTQPGIYGGNWKLANAEGALFGVGSSGSFPLTVEIEVEP